MQQRLEATKSDKGRGVLVDLVSKKRRANYHLAMFSRKETFRFDVVQTIDEEEPYCAVLIDYKLSMFQVRLIARFDRMDAMRELLRNLFFRSF